MVLRHFILFSLATLIWCTPASAQRIAKYGADFLAGGVDARALAMGGANVAQTRNVNSVYWNPSGLAHMEYPEVAYMHAERFAGIVSFDFAGIAYPISHNSTVGLSFFRSGVNDIKNTLNAWDAARNQPKANPESYITSFSAADMAFLLSYARRLNQRFTVGASGKIIRRTIGDFADAWGYSFDVGAQWHSDRFMIGVQLQDLSTMLQSWSVNASAFSIDETNPDTGVPYTFTEVFDQELPTGDTFLVLPVVRLGSGLIVPVSSQSTLTFGLDVDIAFDGQQANAFNLGDLSFHPRLGGEFSFRNLVALRAGVNRIAQTESYGLDIVPSVGAGIRLGPLSVDYGFGDFGGLVSDLGYSHRISVHFTWKREQFRRPSE
ncbi:MAG: PorV/PorQ family protein [Rhodothermaceae bacterium]|nr:PorV/PorQ family protein [Rhodothermaceae bacterium]MYG69408.1 PorV/PorQ family protein [Rhodothermaceae bacterium]MYJ44585.1 PorV/PorQ family protein [Rhodothermaceae bacterium]